MTLIKRINESIEEIGGKEASTKSKDQREMNDKTLAKSTWELIRRDYRNRNGRSGRRLATLQEHRQCENVTGTLTSAFR